MDRRIRVYFDNPITTYYGGDTITGRVVITVHKEEKIRYISASFKGEANVKWSNTQIKDQRNDHTHHVGTTHTAHEKYFEEKYYLIGSRTTWLKLRPGDHVYKFSTTLPLCLPSSFEGKFGHIRYTFKIRVKNPPGIDDDEVLKLFTVLEHLDLNKDPLIKKPVSKVSEKILHYCFCQCGPLTLVVNTPATGFVCGQNIPVTVEVDNGSCFAVNLITCTLKKNVTFTSKSLRCERKTTTTDDVQSKMFGPVTPNTSKTWTRKLKIPTLPPSTLKNCGIIDLNYCLDVKAVTGGFHSDLHVIIPITLGTIPLLSFISPGIIQPHSYPTRQPTQLPTTHTTPGESPQTAATSGLLPPSYSSVTGSDMPSILSQQSLPDRLVPPSCTASSAPQLQYPEIPPPSYEECVYGAISAHDVSDLNHPQTEQEFVPRYPVYNLDV